MRGMTTHGGIVLILLAASLAFNVGFGTMFGVKTYERHCQTADGDTRPCMLTDQLGLTEQQAAMMREAQADLLQRVGEIGEQVTAAHDRLVDLLIADEPDRAAIDAQLDEIASLQRGIQACIVEHLIDGRDSLTVKQRTQFDEVIKLYVCPRGGRGCAHMSGECRPRCKFRGDPNSDGG